MHELTRACQIFSAAPRTPSEISFAAVVAGLFERASWAEESSCVVSAEGVPGCFAIHALRSS